MADIVGIGFNSNQKSLLLKLLNNGLPAFETVHPFEYAGAISHEAMIVNYFEAGKVVAVSDFKVIRIMSWCHF